VRFDHTDIVAAASPVSRLVPRDAADARHDLIARISADCPGAMGLMAAAVPSDDPAAG
jgi:hypothetical protein